MSLERVRRSKIFRLVALILVFDLILAQTLYAQEGLELQEGTHLYTPVKEIPAGPLPINGDLEQKIESREPNSIPLTQDFWNDSPLSVPTPEIHVDETLVEVEDVRSVIPASAKMRTDPSSGGEAGIHGSPIQPFGDDDDIDDINDNEGYDSDFYSFEDALELIRPEFAAAESVVKKWSLWSYGF